MPGVYQTATEIRPSHCPATGSGSPLANFNSSRQTYLLLALLGCFSFIIIYPIAKADSH